MKDVLRAVLGATLTLVVAACDEPQVCTDVLLSYDLEMKRPLIVDGALGELSVEACVDGRCVSGVADESGVISFDPKDSHDNASEGTIDRAGQTIRVTFSLLERDATTRVVLRVRRGDQQLLEEIGNVHWAEGECHSSPEATSI